MSKGEYIFKAGDRFTQYYLTLLKGIGRKKWNFRWLIRKLDSWRIGTLIKMKEKNKNPLQFYFSVIVYYKHSSFHHIK